jgi:cytochrome d ubiquinol oxidase subunit II
MDLTVVWFILIAVLWTGYLVLEGFDFGVAMLLPFVGRSDQERRVALNTIGPVWDGNEVWLLTAGGATFAAFPEWYATLFSGFYLPLLLILVALIVRAVAIEYRGKIDDVAWRRRWDWAIIASAWIPSILWGVAFANIVRGVPIDATASYTGNFFTLLSPFALLGGLTTLALFLSHGAIFLALKTDGEVRARAESLAVKLSSIAVALAGAWAIWAQLSYSVAWTWAAVAVAAVALIAAHIATELKRSCRRQPTPRSP